MNVIKDKQAKLVSLLTESIEKSIPKKKFGLLFSGGVDSCIIALILKKLGCKFTCYTAVLESKSFKEPKDLPFAIKAAKFLKIPLKIIKIKEENIENYLKKIILMINDASVVDAGVALTLFKACEQAKKDNCTALFTGMGSDELFAGYKRFQDCKDINKECASSLSSLFEKDLLRDEAVMKYHDIELKTPFLDEKLIKFALKIPGKFKIKDDQNKVILRESALFLGLDEEFAMRKKLAAQYGSNVHKAIKKLAKKHKLSISDYLKKFSKKIKLAALVSSGKDSIFAMYKMMKQNYDISCMITIKSENPESFMFHTPTIDLVKLQSKSIGIPLLEQKTKGEKEKELQDLKKAIKKAKEKYNIQGIVSGALFSTYQKNRIEKITKELNLKAFSPLWHMNQEKEMRALINEGFEFIITKVSSEGLTKSWLNKIITNKDVDKLIELSKKVQFNIAFEGGEAESLMINGPIFKKRIKITESKIIEESENIAELIIKKAKLVEK